MKLDQIYPYSIYVYYLRHELIQTQCEFDLHTVKDAAKRAEEKLFNKHLMRAKIDGANNFLTHLRKEFPSEISKKLADQMAIKDRDELADVAKKIKLQIPEDLDHLYVV